MDFEQTLRTYKIIVDSQLEYLFDERMRESRDFIKKSYSFLKEFVLRGGKRLRPISTIMAYKAVSDKDEERIYLPAIGIELFHNSSLIHDDIMDEDSERRGMSSMHKSLESLYLSEFEEKKYHGRLFHSLSERFGVSMAILQGNILYALAEGCMAGSSFDSDKVRTALDVINQAYRVINQGQMLDILSELKRDFNELLYLEMITAKTANLFRAAVQIGAVFGEATASQMDALSSCAMDVGMAFQLQDDIIDISPGLKGHAQGSDISRGKHALLMIKAFEKANSKQKHILQSALGNENADPAVIGAAIDVLHATGAVDEARQLAVNKLREAKSSLQKASFLEEGKIFFDRLADFMAQRKI